MRVVGRQRIGAARGRCGGGFSLTELLVAMSVLALLGGLVASMISGVSDMTSRSREQITRLQSARAGFETVTDLLSQATLNTYWDYYDDAGRPALDPAYNGVPKTYGRMSELHFRSGPSSTLLSGLGDPEEHPAHAVFFQAPIGYARESALENLDSLLNSTGFFVEFGSDSDFRPPFLDGIIPQRHRFRLLRMQQSSEKLGIYGVPAGEDWFKKPLGLDPAERPVQVIAENVVALVIRPRLSVAEDSAGTALLGDTYDYDTRQTGQAGATSLHQLPPIVEVAMVVLDNKVAARLADQNGASVPDLGLDAQLFLDPAKMDEDLDALSESLSQKKYEHTVFRTTVGIRVSKWSKE